MKPKQKPTKQQSKPTPKKKPSLLLRILNKLTPKIGKIPINEIPNNSFEEEEDTTFGMPIDILEE